MKIKLTCNIKEYRSVDKKCSNYPLIETNIQINKVTSIDFIMPHYCEENYLQWSILFYKSFEGDYAIEHSSCQLLNGTIFSIHCPQNVFKLREIEKLWQS